MAAGSGDPSALSMSSDQRNRSSRSWGATPSMLPMTIIGNGAAMSRTKSAWPRSHTPSRIWSQIAPMEASPSLMRLGVNPSLTSRRRRKCSGASMSIIMGRGPESGRMPPAFENVSGSLAISLMSAWRVMPQTPASSSK
jgi:hypothetical protein